MRNFLLIFLQLELSNMPTTWLTKTLGPPLLSTDNNSCSLNYNDFHSNLFQLQAMISEAHSTREPVTSCILLCLLPSVCKLCGGCSVRPTTAPDVQQTRGKGAGDFYSSKFMYKNLTCDRYNCNIFPYFFCLINKLSSSPPLTIASSLEWDPIHLNLKHQL